MLAVCVYRTSPRTPVLMDDPLGALREADAPAVVQARAQAATLPPLRAKHPLSDNPVLFRRSATFEDMPGKEVAADTSALVALLIITVKLSYKVTRKRHIKRDPLCFSLH